MGIKERSVRDGDRQEISELIAELRMLCAKTEQFSFDDFVLRNEPELVSECLLEKHREFVFVFVFNEEVQGSRLDTRHADEALHDLRIIEDAEVLAVHMSMVRRDEKKRIGKSFGELFNSLFQRGDDFVSLFAYCSCSMHRAVRLVPVGIDELFARLIAQVGNTS